MSRVDVPAIMFDVWVGSLRKLAIERKWGRKPGPPAPAGPASLAVAAEEVVSSEEDAVEDRGAAEAS